MEVLIKIWKKYEDVILYLFFGVLATFVNITVYYISARVFNIYYLTSNMMAWTVAVFFAYFTNRYFVFQSSARGIKLIFREMLLFFGCRLLSLAIDMIIMYILVTLLGANDFFAKLICQFIVIVSNYIFSKAIVFDKPKAEENNGIQL